MYARRLSQNINTVGSCNLKGALTENYVENFTFSKGTIVRRQFSRLKNTKDFRIAFNDIINKAKSLKERLFQKSSPEKTLKVWARQFEFVFAQRVRRGQQMFCLYSKWWEEKALKEFIKRLRVSCTRHGKEFMISATGLSLYNWDENRIKDQEFHDHLDDLKYIEVLKEQTICLSCEHDKKSSTNSRICECGTGGITNKSYDNWVPFIEKDDLIVWRKPLGDGLFEYKVYGSYYDVTAEDFLNVQVDTDYRKEWDTTAVHLELGERDIHPDSNSDILYWEMQWPRLFVNRDYVFNRRYMVFEENKTLIIINKTTEYPKFPKYPDKYRVDDYWSCMVIKPYKDVKQPGIEFCLTYFDNPGVNIPSSITTWVAKSAMPDFLIKLRNASKHYREYCLRKGTNKACEVIQEEDRQRREEEEKNKLQYCSNDRLALVLTNIHQKANEKLLEFKKKHQPGALVKTAPISSEEVETPPSSTSMQKETNTRSLWRYLHPFYYFT